MPTPHHGDVRRTASQRSGARCAVLALTLAAAAALAVACGASTAPPSPDAAAVVSSLGAVHIPPAPATDPRPTASGTRPQLLAMGRPVAAVLDATTEATVTATGPEQTITTPTSSGPARSTPATITMTLTATRGTLTLAAADLTCRDDTGSTITLTPVGAPNVPVGAGTTATVHVRGVFRSGAAQITWHPGGHPLALWDFNVELD